MKEPAKEIIVDILRYDPQAEGEPTLQTYRILSDRETTLLALLRHIYEDLDPTLAFRDYHCGRAICGSCRLRLGGKAVKACHTIVRPGERVMVGPLEKESLIRDLAVAFD
ncbi:MAG: 2Fe-2S iron-sulfur cluster-binding protein [Chloroflexi bacterium]|nr:2Fe-2S iron-sulfur cluster-binding protein [Chloroflexota bacterium]MCL5074994.1 2Fe-2S iron-sulfur cluster-binding protein [Chloroflexota bacterium]